MIENSALTYHQIVDLALVFCIWFAALLLIHKNYRKAFFLLSTFTLAFFYLLNWLNLPLLEGVANQAFWVSFILLMIVFQPELRRMFERIRHLQDFLPFLFEKRSKNPSTIKALLSCVSQLSESQTGALIVLENKSNLDEYADSGINIDAKIICSNEIGNSLVPRNSIRKSETPTNPSVAPTPMNIFTMKKSEQSF